ncbi:hypothetical protein [Lactococcus sp. DD01]|uniref:hypothetical protein n=1 Tax=Lactococcus sp. DD01 TaxID=1776443 RepID=UPI00077606ED|nr:hypothetical protein [Lactococcus sp. DD01]KXT63190.1 hypothetical protein LACDD01_00134 [Lactococcus sp. DD01]
MDKKESKPERKSKPVKTMGKGDTFKFIHKMADGTIIADEDWAQRNIDHPDNGPTARKYWQIGFEDYVERGVI